MKQFILMLDTETAMKDSTKEVYGCNALAYDLGCAIVDRNGNVYETLNFVIDEIFHGEYEKMRTCYYAEKLPQYYLEIGQGIRIVKSLAQAQKEVLELMEKYNCKTVGAYNTSFDYYTLKTTSKWCGGEWAFFPQDTKYIDVYKMARQVYAKNKRYVKFCETNGYVTEKGNPQVKAETVYRYITKDLDFVEAHTGLCDVMIETEIMARINKMHKKVEREIIFSK